jgi:hypothetical protein
MLQRKRCVPFRRAAYVGGGIKMRPPGASKQDGTCFRKRLVVETPFGLQAP